MKMKYEYLDLVTDEVFEVEHPMDQPAYTHRNVDGRWYDDPLHQIPTTDEVHPVKRLISQSPETLLKYKIGDTGGWADKGYSHCRNKRRADKILGRS